MMAPGGGHYVLETHFDRAESEPRAAEKRAELSERSEFSARRCTGLKRGYPPEAGRANGCLFFGHTFLWTSKERYDTCCRQ